MLWDCCTFPLFLSWTETKEGRPSRFPVWAPLFPVTVRRCAQHLPFRLHVFMRWIDATRPWPIRFVRFYLYFRLLYLIALAGNLIWLKAFLKSDIIWVSNSSKHYDVQPHSPGFFFKASAAMHNGEESNPKMTVVFRVSLVLSGPSSFCVSMIYILKREWENDKRAGKRDEHLCKSRKENGTRPTDQTRDMEWHTHKSCIFSCSQVVWSE